MEVEVKQINLQEEHLCDSASQSACPETYGNPEHKGRPGGVPIEKFGGKNGGELWYSTPRSGHSKGHHSDQPVYFGGFLGCLPFQL